MFAQELDDPVDAIVLSATGHGASALFLGDEACANQPAQMKGERGRRYVETGLDIGDVEAGRSSPYQEPIDIQPGQIAQFGQATRRKFAIHASKYRNEKRITTTILVL